MSNPRSWVEALNINPESLSEWSAQAPAGKPLLVWCLEQGHVSLENYFAWAQEFFGLPVLDSGYFSNLDASLLDEVRHEGSWHPWRFPVDKWDDVTIVACVEPPTDQDHPLVTYVLADPRAMTAAWGSTQTNIPNPVAIEMPSGFTGGTKPFVLNLDGDLFTKTSAQSPPPSNMPMSAPPLSAEPPSAEPPPFEDDSLLISNLMMDPPTLTTVSPKAPKLSVVPNESVAPPQAPPNTPAPVNANEDEAIQIAFKEIVTKYHHAVLMKCSDNKAKLYRADSNLKVANASRTTIELSYPTFLRIVSKTLLPYHGYLIDSPAHRQYFEGLGLNELPGCVTAVPIHHDGRVLGVLVAFGSPDLLKADFLNFVSQTAARLAQVITVPWSQAS